MSPTRIKFLAFRVYRFRDPKAFDALYVQYARQLHRYIAHKVPRSEDAEELSAELFLRSWEYMTTSSVENVQAFFYKVARNLIADFYRRQQPQEQLDERDVEVVGQGSLEGDIGLKLEVEKLQKIMARLKPEYREVLALRFMSEMSIEEIAVALEKTANNVRVLLHRAKQALRSYEEKP